MFTDQKTQPRSLYKQWQMRLKISVIFVHLALAVLFWAFQKFESSPTFLHTPVSIKIVLEEIPVTNQEVRVHRVERPDPAVDISVNFSDEPEWPDSIPIFAGEGKTARGEGTIVSMPFKQARILFENYPVLEKLQCRGKVKLLLLIDENGRVSDIEVIENSTGSPDCLEAAKIASLRSRWLPAMQGQSRVASWVEKVYVFGAPR